MTRRQWDAGPELDDALPWRDPGWPQYPSLRFLPTIGDGSCLIHAVYACLAPRHRDRMCSTSPGKHAEACERVQKIRSEMAVLLPEYYESLPCADFEDVKVDTDEGDISYDVESLQELIDSERYLGEEFVIFLSIVLCVNIIILNKTRRCGYQQAVSPKLYDASRRGSVIIFYDEKTRHFEAAGLRVPNGHVATHFENRNVFLEPFKRLVRWE